MKELFIRLDNFLDRKWRETCEVLFYLAGKKPEEDIDWLNINNQPIIKEKKGKKNG
jgi:hypothetical protein